MVRFVISNRNLTSLKGIEYPEDITELDCSHNPLTSLKYCPKNISTLICDHIQITSLKYCSKHVERLFCSYTQIKSLKYCHDNIRELLCSNNSLVSFKYLPLKIKRLDINSIDVSSSNMKKYSHLLKSLQLTSLSCNHDQLKYFIDSPSIKSSYLKDEFQLVIYDNLNEYKAIYLKNNKYSVHSLTLEHIKLFNHISNIKFVFYSYEHSFYQGFYQSDIKSIKSKLTIENHIHLLKIIKMSKIKRNLDKLWSYYWYDILIHDDVSRFCFYCV